VLALEKSKLAKLISKEIWNSTQDQIDLYEYCAAKLKNTYPGLSKLQINDELDNIIAKVKFYINKRIEHCKKQGTTPEYEFNDYPPDILFRYSLKHREEPSLSTLRKQRPEILRAIKEMPWKKFEYLCKHILEINGVIKSYLASQHQEGIDFYGLVDIDKYFPGVLFKGCKLRIIGQAKRLSKEVGPNWIRSFKTYLDDVHNKKEDVLKKFPAWFTEIKAPILGIFITTSKFTKGAFKYAKREGIILRNGEQIIEDLIKSTESQTWLSQDKNGRSTFDKNAFLQFFTNTRH